MIKRRLSRVYLVHPIEALYFLASAVLIGMTLGLLLGSKL